jgi:hypothetical protein
MHPEVRLVVAEPFWFVKDGLCFNMSRMRTLAATYMHGEKVYAISSLSQSRGILLRRFWHLLLPFRQVMALKADDITAEKKDAHDLDEHDIKRTRIVEMRDDLFKVQVDTYACTWGG